MECVLHVDEVDRIHSIQADPLAINHQLSTNREDNSEAR